MAPRVFLSHASEDKDRFVLGFAAKLRQRGVDVWLDRWEMLPGDSLVDKIFEEGIKEASAVIVILSKVSVERPWVKEELNAAFVRRVNAGSRLIPVVIDDCDVPEALHSIVWEKIDDMSSYDESLGRILAAIFGDSAKPPLGSPPAYTQGLGRNIGGLSGLDSLILKLLCEMALAKGDHLVSSTTVFARCEELDVPETELFDSIEMLDRGHYIKWGRTMQRRSFYCEVLVSGFEAYACVYVADYQDIVAAVMAAIVNKSLANKLSIVDEVKQSRFIVGHVLDVFEQRGLLRQAKTIGGGSHVYGVSPALKRMLG